MATNVDETVIHRPTELVRAAVEALAMQFFEPLAVADLFRDAWEGATATLARAVVSMVPPIPDYPADPVAAYAVHAATFPALEELAAGRISAADLTAAALRELLDRRRDGHTFFFSPRMLKRALSTTERSFGTFGLILTDTTPLAVADVLPRGPAQRAGLRRGHRVLIINGQPVEHLRRFEAQAVLDWQVGAANTLTVQTSGGETTDLQLRSDSRRMLMTDILPGPFGLLRWDTFGWGAALVEELRGALAAFEQGGVLGWVMDMRWNTGGVSIDVSRLLVNHGCLFSRQRHNEVRLPDGDVLPTREDIDAGGTALPFQRPLVVLVGPGSMSGAESFAGPLQAHGRATLVGERTAGLCGGLRSIDLAPGWRIALTYFQTLLGPEEWRLNRVGVTPDLVVTPSTEDEAAGRDPQLDAALDILRSQTATY